jgi:hypothetical protein
MTMQFSHRVSLLLAAATISGIKLGHLAGQSCFKTYNNHTKQNLIYLRHAEE